MPLPALRVRLQGQPGDGEVSLDYGIHDIGSDTYHSDPCDQPSLSASIANILVNKSPAHARAAHPRLNPDLERDDDIKFDIGTAAHALFLQGTDGIGIAPFDDWRTAAAKELRTELRMDGRIPLLTSQAERVYEMVEAVKDQVAGHGAQPALFADGLPEQTLIWKDDHDVTCRARLDWLRDDYTACDDLKSTSASANPRAWRKTMWGIGAALQAQFYRRGAERLTGIRPAFRFAVIETYPPFALSVVSLDPSAEAVADAQIDWALRTWAECIEKDDWPAYSRQVHHVDAPAYVEADWLERQWQEAAA